MDFNITAGTRSNNSSNGLERETGQQDRKIGVSIRDRIYLDRHWHRNAGISLVVAVLKPDNCRRNRRNLATEFCPNQKPASRAGASYNKATEFFKQQGRHQFLMASLAASASNNNKAATAA